MTRSLGVGFLGAGPVTQAIHLPTLATLPNHFRVTDIMDVDGALAERVASRCDAKWTTDANAVIENPAVDVVAVCSPNGAHAAQVIAACAAGKTAVLCEKPLAVSHAEAHRIGEAAAASGTHLVVGAMHVYDPAYRAAHRVWDELGETSRLTQSRIYLPSNDVFIEQATQLASPAGPPPAPQGSSTPVALMLRSGILGLAIHNLPLIRQFHPQLGELSTASFLPPFGYKLVLGSMEHSVELLALMGGGWPPTWTLRTIGVDHELRVTFPPSYVSAGSARAEVIGADRTMVFEEETNGYQQQWRALHASSVEGAEPLVTIGTAVDDIIYALDLADRTDQLLAGAS